MSDRLHSASRWLAEWFAHAAAVLAIVSWCPPAAGQTDAREPGLLFRAAIGPSYVTDRIRLDGRDGAPRDGHVTGPALGAHVSLAGSVSRTVALGGYILYDHGLDAHASLDERARNAGITLASLGAELDWQPFRGVDVVLTAGLGLGYTELVVLLEENSERRLSGLLGTFAAFSYGTRIAPRWTLGGMLRLTVISLGEEVDRVAADHTALGASLLLTLTYW